MVAESVVGGGGWLNPELGFTVVAKPWAGFDLDFVCEYEFLCIRDGEGCGRYR